MPLAPNFFQNAFMNPMFMGGLGMLSGSLQRKKEHTPFQDFMGGSKFAQATQQMAQQKELYDLQKQEIAAKQEAAQKRQEAMTDLFSPDPMKREQAYAYLSTKDYIKSQLPKEVAPTSLMIEAQKLYPGNAAKQEKYITEARHKALNQINIGGKPITMGEYKQESMIVRAGDMAAEIRTLVDKGVDTGTKGAFKSFIESSPKLSWIPYTNLTDDEARMHSLVESYSNTLIQAARGAQVGSEEIEQFKVHLPQLGQSKEIFLSNLDTTEKTIIWLNERAKERRKELGGTGEIPGVKPPDKSWQTTPSGYRIRVQQ